MPSVPVGANGFAPSGLEFAYTSIASQNVNPFNAQQQVYDWLANWWEASVSLPPMRESDAESWITFFAALDGPVNYFVFPTALCTKYPKQLTTDGTTPRNWCLKGGPVHHAIKPGSIYSFTFEIREAK
jgi:hypothetical protein